jgi:kinetochore protein Nuf2
MSATAIEDKQTVTLHEAKARDLQAKINAFSNIEKVSSLSQTQTLLANELV